MLDWTALPHDEPLYEADVDLSEPIADYDAHLSVIRDAAVQLPEELTGLLAELVRRLDGLAAKESLILAALLAAAGASPSTPPRCRAPPPAPRHPPTTNPRPASGSHPRRPCRFLPCLRLPARSSPPPDRTTGPPPTDPRQQTG
ncbi:hypothetical protein [Streptomyces subrutilus]|nr:hypothetical protein [Streptomyces subrutilus]